MVLAACWIACESGEAEPRTTPAPSAATSAPAPEPVLPPTPRAPTTFASSDGAALAGDLYLAADPSAPAVVVLHRLEADRSELAPLVLRLASAKKRFTVLTFDLRGHGASKAPPKAKADDVSHFHQDVRAAIAHVLEKSSDKTRGVVLVGSSFGATLAAKVAYSEPKVTALALVSPGAAIRGIDLYRPYAEVRNLPTFFATAKDDTVSADPASALAKMAQRGTSKAYEGSRHSAGHLGEQHAALWADLEQWLLGVYEEAPIERRSLDYAPGKEPKKPGAQGAKKPGER